MKTTITLEIDNVPEGVVLKILSRALDLYDFHHEEEMSESDVKEWIAISDSITSCYFDWYANSGVMTAQYSMHPPSTDSEFDDVDVDVDSEDLMKWLVDSGALKFNEDGSPDLMSLRSPELILEQEKKAKEIQLLYRSGKEKYNKFLKTLTQEERKVLEI
jgi:hypothetical protein